MIKYNNERQANLEFMAIINVEDDIYKLDITKGVAIKPKSIIAELSVYYLKNSPIYSLELTGTCFGKGIHAYKHFIVLEHELEPNIGILSKDKIESIFLDADTNIDIYSPTIHSIITQILYNTGELSIL